MKQEQAAHWDGRNEQEQRVSSGLYVYGMVIQGHR